MKFAVAVLIFALGYTVLYYSLYMLASYDPGDPGETHAIPFTVLLGHTPNVESDNPSQSMYASPPFNYQS